MANYSTPFASGTIASFSGTTTTVSGFTPDASYVGRLVIIQDGSAKLQHREIIAVEGQDLTLAHAWNQTPFIDPTMDKRATDVNPAVGDAIVVSYDADDLIATDGDMTLTNTNDLVLGTVSVSGGAYIHFKDYDVEFNAPALNISRGAGLIFGYYGYVENEDGYPKDSCNVTDKTNTFDGMRAGNEDFGLLDIYGGSVHHQGSPFWRCYEGSGNPADAQVRLINTTHYGSMGGRIDGNRSMVVATCVGARTTVGFANPRSAVARFDVSMLDCNQAGYVYLKEGPSGRAVFPRLSRIGTRLLRVTGVGGSGQVYEVIAKKAEVDQVPIFATVDSTQAGHILRYGNLVKPFFTYNLAPADEVIKATLIDNTGATLSDQSITDGRFVEVFARHTDINTVAGNRQLTDGAAFGPYSLRVATYEYVYIDQPLTIEDEFSSEMPLTLDLLVTDTEAVTAARTEHADGYQAYDAMKLDLRENSNPQPFTRALGTLVASPAQATNITIDANASNPYAYDQATNTVTIKAAIYNGDITTPNGMVTALNGAKIRGVITDQTRDAAFTFSGVESWTRHSNASDASTGDSPIISGVGQDYVPAKFNPASPEIGFFRVVVGGTSFAQQKTLEGLGKTVIALGVEAQLKAMFDQVTMVRDGMNLLKAGFRKLTTWLGVR